MSEKCKGCFGTGIRRGSFSALCYCQSKPKIELEVGKSYRTREGKKVTLTDEWHWIFRGNDGILRHIDGNYCGRFEASKSYDIISEWEDDVELSLSQTTREIRMLGMAAEIQELKHDIDAYRGALGYTVPGHHDGRLSNGEIPKCGLCEAKQPKAQGEVVSLEDMWVIWYQAGDYSLIKLLNVFKYKNHAKQAAEAKGITPFSIVPYGTTKFSKGEGL